MIPVKICGIRRLEDALLALDEGAWALGFIFHRSSPRFIEPGEAAALLAEIRGRSASGFKAVGVFVDWAADDLDGVVREVGLDAVQLHGDESPDYAAGVKAGEVWKAFRVGSDFAFVRLAGYPPKTRILLDGWSPTEAGGTGRAFDWSVARACQESRPVILAGGIDVGNVAAAISEVKPFAVDVSSGVESAPGVKDGELIRKFFSEVRACPVD